MITIVVRGVNAGENVPPRRSTSTRISRFEKTSGLPTRATCCPAKGCAGGDGAGDDTGTVKMRPGRGGCQARIIVVGVLGFWGSEVPGFRGAGCFRTGISNRRTQNLG